MSEPVAAAVAALARQSRGSSDTRLVAWAAAAIRQAGGGGTVLDLGCGGGELARALRGQYRAYVGVDAAPYARFAELAEARFVAADLNRAPLPLPEGCADTVAAVETIEHLENPRGLLREMRRLARPGGLLLVTTPNQLSWRSKLGLLLRDEFPNFREAPGLYPTHITALLAGDLMHLAAECGLRDAELRWLGWGRMPGVAAAYPGWLARLAPRGCSDNVLLLGRTPA